jgi:SPP1 gp7 family putative phage head morphogenesis protein
MSIRLQMSRGGLPAQNYIRERGGPVLLRHYKKIYADVFDSLVYRSKEARTGRSRFMEEQLSYLERNAANRIADISQATSDHIQTIVLNGVRQGLSNDAIALRLADAIPEISRQRAAVIARTETHNAASAAMFEAVQHQRIEVQTKTWITVGDHRVRSSHRSLNGVTIPFRELFEADSGPMMFPGDNSHGAGAEDIVNCRCSVLYNT